ncbi:MAG: peptide MFS transporter [Bacteroidota bacterium]
MFKGHPKGLFVAFFTNMGERFGFYTMMAILVLFLQARYGLTEAQAGDYYSWFYFAIYALALLGGLFADWTKKYKMVILLGQIIMFAGYAIIAIPGMPLSIALLGLFTIALGNGLFKGNLQAVVGQLYDDEKYSKLRDSAFMVFYMGINIGAFFAPFVATGIRNYWLRSHGFLHDGSIPALCHQFKNGTMTDTAQFADLAHKVDLNGTYANNLSGFADSYLNIFAQGYNYAFALAACAMVVSLLVYIIFNKSLPNKEKTVAAATDKPKVKTGATPIVVALTLIAASSLVFNYTMDNYKLGLAIGLFLGFASWIFLSSTKEEKPSVTSLLLVYVVVIFFWMSFHQNGLTLTFFARDYTVKEVGPLTFLFFNLESILCVIATIAGLVMVFSGNKETKNKLIGGALTLVFGAICFYMIGTYGDKNPISPEVFQSFNPLFIVALTPLVMGFFGMLNKRGIEPSTPRKIGIGMIIAALGFLVVLIVSINLVSPYLLGGVSPGAEGRVSPYWLMSSYLILTVAELFLSPMGLSFVSKVAPVRFQGLMQGGWLLATAVGNKLLFVGSLLWGRIDLYMLWAMFLLCCLVSAVFIFAIMKRLENATK